MLEGNSGSGNDDGDGALRFAGGPDGDLDVLWQCGEEFHEAGGRISLERSERSRQQSRHETPWQLSRLHAEDAEGGGGRGAGVERSGNAEGERRTGVERIDHAVVPQARARKITTGFQIVFGERRAGELGLFGGGHFLAFAGE